MKTQNAQEPTQSLTLEVAIDATPAEVWDALTTAEGLTRWFPPQAEVTPGNGGRIWLSWGGGVEGEAPIHRWEPPHRLAWTEGEDAAQHVVVEWVIEAKGGGALVRVVQSGFGENESWDDYFDATRRGWRYFLVNLQLALERHRGTPRTMISCRRPRSKGPADCWHELFGPSGLAAQDDARSVEPGRSYRLRLSDELSLEATRAGGEYPWTFWATLPELDDGVIFVEMETQHCGIWLSTYGRPEGEGGRLQAALDALADRVAW